MKIYKREADIKKSLEERRSNTHIKMDLDWIQVAVDGVQWWGLVT